MTAYAYAVNTGGVADISELIRSGRLARRWSLKQLGEQIAVTPAYVADLEAGRRRPSPELLARIARALDISPEELAAADTRLAADLRDWIEERPLLTSMLRLMRASANSDKLIQRLSRLVGRNAQPRLTKGLLVTWESEIRAIAAEASAWSIETGGDLFGRWHDLPVVLLATKAGPAAQRSNAHFRLDVEYLRQLSDVMATDWGLRYFGDWHSHHRLGLSAPSSGDRKRIVGLGTRNALANMAEVIVTLDDSRSEPLVRIHPWLYDLSGAGDSPLPLRVKVLPGISPIREALIARQALPEQDLHSWEKVSLQRVRIGTDTAPPPIESVSDVDIATREKVLTHLVKALTDERGSEIEQHATGFGSIIVAKVREPEYVAFALGAAWPMPILEVHRMDRARGATEPVQGRAHLTALDVSGIVALYRDLRGTRHVDN